MKIRKVKKGPFARKREAKKKSGKKEDPVFEAKSDPQRRSKVAKTAVRYANLRKVVFIQRGEK